MAPPDAVDQAHAPSAKPQHRTAGESRARARATPVSDEGMSGRPVRPASDEADVRWRHERVRRHSRHDRLEVQGRSRQAHTHAARRTRAAFDFRELVQVMHRGSVCVMRVVPRRSMSMRPGSVGRLQHPMVIRSAAEQGRRREALQRQGQQQEPHQDKTQAGMHRDSVKRTSPQGLRDGGGWADATRLQAPAMPARGRRPRRWAPGAMHRPPEERLPIRFASVPSRPRVLPRPSFH